MNNLLSWELGQVMQVMQNKSRYNQLREVAVIGLISQELNYLQKELQQTQELNQNVLRNVVGECLTIDNVPFHLVFTQFLCKCVNVSNLAERSTLHLILQYLLSYQERSSPQLTIKSIQCFIPLLQQQQLNFDNLEYVEQILRYIICNRTSEQQFVSQTCLTLQQQVLDCLVQDCLHHHHEPSSIWIEALSKCILDCVSMLNEHRPLWFPTSIQLDKELALNILIGCFGNVSKDVLTTQHIQSTLMYNLPKAFNGASHEHIGLTYKCITMLLTADPIQFIGLTELLKKHLEQPQHSPHKSLTYQTLLQLAINGTVAKSLHLQPGKVNPFNQILMSLVDVVQSDVCDSVERQKSATSVLRLISKIVESLSIVMDALLMGMLWKTCHRILKCLLKMTLEESLLIIVHATIQNFIYCSHKLQFLEAQDYFITLACTPRGSVDTLIHLTQSSQSAKIQITCEQWALILKSFIEYHKVDPLSLCNEYDIEHLLLVLEALFRYIQDGLECDSALLKVVIMVKKNLHRLGLIWDELVRHLMALLMLHTENELLAVHACDTLGEIIILAFKQQDYDSKWLDHYQDILLTALTEAYKIKSVALRESIFRHLRQLLTCPIDSGGWKQTLRILSLAYTDVEFILQVVNSLVQLSSQLDSMSQACSEEYLFLLHQIQLLYRVVSYDEQICQIFWKVWVHCYKKGQCECKILDSLLYYACLPHNPETRRASTNVITNIISNYDGKGTQWLSLVTNYSFEVFKCILVNLGDQDEEGWHIDAINSLEHMESLLCECDTLYSHLLPHLTNYIFQVIQLDHMHLITPFAERLLQMYSQYALHFNGSAQFRQILDHFGSCYAKPSQDKQIVLIHIQNLLPIVLELTTNILSNNDPIIIMHTIPLLAKIALIPTIPQITKISDEYQIMLPDSTLCYQKQAMISEEFFLRGEQIFQKQQINLNSLLSDSHRDAFYEYWSTILDATPSNHETGVYLTELLSHLHGLLLQITDSAYLFRLLMKLQHSIKRLRSDDAYLQQEQYKSLWFHMGEILLSLAGDDAQTLTLLQDTLPSSTHYDQIVGFQRSYDENLEFQNNTIRHLSRGHLSQYHEVPFVALMSHFQTLHLQVIMSPIEALVAFCSSGGARGVHALPVLMSLSRTILSQYIENHLKFQSTLPIFLLRALISLQLPRGLFRQAHLSDDFVLQDQRGHLCCLMPMLSQCVTTQDDDVRVLLSQCVDLISKVLI